MEATAQQSLVVSVSEFSRLSGIGPETIRKLLKAGQIASTKIGNSRRIYATEVQRLLCPPAAS